MTGSNNQNDSNHNHSNNNNNNDNDNNNNNKFLQSKQQQQQQQQQQQRQHFDNNNHGTTSPWANRRAPVNGTTSRKRITKKGMVRVQMILSASIFLVFLNVAVLLHRHSTIDNTANSLHDVLPNFAMTAELEAKVREEPRQQEGAAARAEEVLQEALEEGQKLGQIVLDNERREQNANANTNHTPYVSLVVVLTDHNKTSNVLASLLPSILQQQQPHHQHQGYLFNFEIVIVDASCHDDSFLNRDIQRFLEHTTLNPRKIRHTYVQACDTPGYAVLANRAVANTAASSQFILLLNEHVVLQNETFVQNMVELVEAKHNAAAVGCKLLTKNVDTLIEAGGILWSDASTTSFGVDRTDLDAPEFLFPRPVDYVSGACLMVNKTIFQEYGGFEGNSQQLLSSNQHYQELDLQTHIQHDLHMEVWVQPSAVATHADPASVGNGDNNKNKSLRHSNAGPFQEKWKEYLVHHPPTPSYHNLSNHSRHVELLKASDLRARDPTKARILYLDQLIPNQNMGRGFGRAFDNLSMLAELGHRITAMAMEVPTEKWCDAACLEETRRLGIEVVTTTPWEEFTAARVGFYDIVLISRPSTFAQTYKKWREFYKQSPFAIVYDCEALWYRRDIDMLNLYKEGIQFPSIGAVHENYIPVKELMTSEQKTSEETILKLADIIVPVSEKEADIIADLIPGGNIEAIGHVMKLPDRKSVPFQKRKGILFLASFNNDMYYNGDAIWYFLKETYPLVLKDSPIPLSIAGHDIPEKLRNFTRDNGLDDHVTFFESLVDTTPLFDNARVFIAPHLYGSGIQFKLSECLSMGIATVMSKLSADAFGIKPDDHIACVGDTPESFKSCVLSVHNNETMWNTMRHNGLEFIKRTHSQKHVQELWKKVIDNGKAIFKEIQLDEIAAKSNPPPAEFKCPEGEKRYKEMYSDVAATLQKVKKTKYTKANRMQEKTGFSSAFDHWRQAGESEGRKYTCDYNAKLFKTEIWTTTPTGPCPVGEKLYQIQYPIVREMIETGKIRSGYREWLRYGKAKRRNYFCEDDLRALNLPEDSWVMQFIKG